MIQKREFCRTRIKKDASLKIPFADYLPGGGIISFPNEYTHLGKTGEKPEYLITQWNFSPRAII